MNDRIGDDRSGDDRIGNDRVGNTLAEAIDWAFRRLRATPRMLFGRWVERLPLDFRVLYKQFLLRILDLEALSIEADLLESI